MVATLKFIWVLLLAVLILGGGGLAAYWFYVEWILQFSTLKSIDKGTVVWVLVAVVFCLVIATVGAVDTKAHNEHVRSKQATEEPRDDIPQLKAKPGRIREVDWL
jgi:hypothetical protein